MYTIFNVRAFVLGYRNLGDDDRGYYLFTDRFGLLFAVAKGVRKEKSKNRYVMVLGARVAVDLIRGRYGWKIASARGDEDLDMDRCLNRVLLLEDIRRMVVFEEPMRRVFDLLDDVGVSDEYHGEVGRYRALKELFSILGYWGEAGDDGVMGGNDLIKAVEKIRLKYSI